MNSAIIQLLVLAGIAIFLILRLRNVLGTREGFEKPREDLPRPSGNRRGDFEVIEGGVDRDIADHVEDGSTSADALARMKRVENNFGVSDFLGGARGAYEMILMAFENGDLTDVQGFLSEDVHEAFQSVIDARADQGLTVDANFVGISELHLDRAEFSDETSEAELTVRFVAELTSVVRDKAGEIVEGDATKIKRQRDVWTFARTMGSNDPNWQLVVTGE